MHRPLSRVGVAHSDRVAEHPREEEGLYAGWQQTRVLRDAREEVVLELGCEPLEHLPLEHRRLEPADSRTAISKRLHGSESCARVDFVHHRVH